MGSSKSFIISMSLSLILTFTMASLFRRSYLSSADFVNSRAKQFLNFLDSTNSQNSINLIFGSSELFVNFSVMSLNSNLSYESYFYLMSSPDFSLEKQALFIDKIKQGRIKKVIVPLSLASLGKSHLVNKSEEWARFAETMDHSDIWQTDQLRFAHKVEISLQKFFHFNRLRDLTQWLWAQRDEHSLADFSQLWLDSEFVENPFWNIASHGDYLFNQKRSNQFQLLSGNLLHNTKEHERTIQYYQNCCQLLSLRHLDEGLTQWLRNIRAFENLGAEVFIVYFPSSPQAQAMRTVEAKQYLQDIKRLVENKFAKNFFDLESQTHFDSYDYLDAVHLSKKGQDKVQRALAQFINQ